MIANDLRNDETQSLYVVGLITASLIANSQISTIQHSRVCNVYSHMFILTLKGGLVSVNNAGTT